MRPLLLVLEDLHWSDESTLVLLCHLAETVREIPVLILGTHREVAEDVRRPLADAMEILVRRHRCHRISVSRLSEVGVAAMIRAITGQDPSDPVVAAIHVGTEGNPFFVEEVVRYLVDEGRLVDGEGRLRPDVAIGDLDVPDRVRLVVGRRLARLGCDTRRVLTAAAVIGRGFGIDLLLEAMSEVDGEAWLDAIDEAERARLIVPSDDVRSAGYRFAHEFIRQTLVADVSLTRRQRLHLRVAEAMLRIESGGARLQAAEIAHHLVQAGALADRQTTIHYLALAADRANAAAAFEEALQHVRTALDMLPGSDRSGRAPLLEKLAQALHSVGRWDEALDVWRKASAVHEECGDITGLLPRVLASKRICG
jgi:predicted ATPase